MQSIYYKLGLFLLLLAGVTTLQAQISSGGTPFSLNADFKNTYEKTNALKEALLPAFPLAKVLKEDAVSSGIRFAAPIEVDLGLDNAGTWTELKNGDRLWRLKIRSAHALGLSALYDALYLPPGAQLFMYSEDGKQILGAYTHQSNTPNLTFMTGFLNGETAIIEYFEPKAVRGQGQLHIFRVDHAYNKSVFQEKSGLAEFGFGAAQPCNINANCAQGLNWQKQKRGVCRIIVVVEQGTGYCTGNLLNNTENDGTPYVLSAFHCQDGFTPKYDFWRYDFNYESPNCANPSNEPTYQSMLGSTLRASRRQNDFLLLELIDTIPSSYNVYFNGWDRKSSPPTTSFSFHHPKGDIKKFSIENQNAIIYSPVYQWQRSDGSILSTTPSSHMFRIQFDESTVEVGSSGAALFDNNGRIVGQLHGGNELGSCTVNSVFYDRFSLSWDGGGTPSTRLRDWLDPDTTNVTNINGLEKTVLEGPGTLAGFVKTAEGEGIAGVSVTLDGTTKMTTITDTAGAYSFLNLPPTGTYTVSLEKDFGDKNGVDALDVVFTSKHILSVTTFDHPLKIWAADVNNSKNVTVLDIVTMRKLILGIDTEFAALPSWRFIPADFQFSDPANPWDDFISSKFSVPKLDSAVLNFNFTGFKTGDVNFSANPKN